MRKKIKYLFLYGMVGAGLGVGIIGTILTIRDYDSVTLALTIGALVQVLYWVGQIKDERRRDRLKDRWASWFKYDGPNYREW